MASFTKGTWILDAKNGSIKLQKDGTVIATVQHAEKNTETSTEEGVANARLISKAPEMYKALGKLLNYARKTNEQSVSNGITKDIKNVEALFAYIDGKKGSKA